MTGENDSDGGASTLTTEQTRIRIDGRRRNRATRPPRLTDALDFWSLAGAAANVAMQMARPGVGYGVVESKVDSGALMRRPMKRARTTTQYLAVAVLGTDEQRAAYRRAVNSVHRRVRSEPGAAVTYNAFDRDLQLWVAACLFVGSEDAYQLVYGKMTAEQAESFYSTSATLGTTLQVRPDMWPATRAEFDRYWNAQCARVRVDAKVRAYLDDLLNLRMVHPVARLPLRGPLRFLTIGFLAPHFRREMGLDWSAADQRRFDRAFHLFGLLSRVLPRAVRHAIPRALVADVRRRMASGKPLV
ncbi:oxygenase MpaB family protein [Nocardia takedensis]